MTETRKELKKARRLRLEARGLAEELEREALRMAKAIDGIDPGLRLEVRRERVDVLEAEGRARLAPIQARLVTLGEELSRLGPALAPAAVLRQAPNMLAAADAQAWQERIVHAPLDRILMLVRDAVRTGDHARAVLAAEVMLGRSDVTSGIRKEIDRQLGALTLDPELTEAGEELRAGLAEALRLHVAVAEVAARPLPPVARLAIGHLAAALEREGADESPEVMEEVLVRLARLSGQSPLAMGEPFEGAPRERMVAAREAATATAE